MGLQELDTTSQLKHQQQPTINKPILGRETILNNFKECFNLIIQTPLFYLLFGGGEATLCSLWDLRSLARDQTCAPLQGQHRVLTSGPLESPKERLPDNVF